MNHHRAGEESAGDAAGVDASPRFVGFWARALASVIDSILLLIALLPVLFIFYGDELLASEGQLEGWSNLLFNYLLPMMVVLIFWFLRSATPGKIVIKARIVDADSYERPETWQWIVRYLGYYVSIFVFFMGFVWVAWDERKQGWHDKLARTVVVYED